MTDTSALPRPVAQLQKSSQGKTPSWMTPELLAYTLETWQPFYKEALTETDAVEILLNVGRLVEGIMEKRR